RRFGSWLRTVRKGVPPSEQVVALALRESLPEFIAGFRNTNPLAKIISENLDLDRAEGFRLAS
ncbi:IS4 family transposase, partial [bacterium]|nr:IS4 family transposase [bacterium]